MSFFKKHKKGIESFGWALAGFIVGWPLIKLKIFSLFGWPLFGLSILMLILAIIQFVKE